MPRKARKDMPIYGAIDIQVDLVMQSFWEQSVVTEELN
jgi:hypothetical protein